MKQYKIRATLDLHAAAIERTFTIDEATFEKIKSAPGQDDWLLLPQQGGGACAISTKRIAFLEMWESSPVPDDL